MSKFTLLRTVILLFLESGIFSLQAQILYSATSAGGNSGGGTIGRFIPSTNKLIVAKSIEGGFGANPAGDLIQATDGKLYGMTSGVIFSFDPSNSTSSFLSNFDAGNGAIPRGSLTQASNGKLYGLTSNGGSSDAGTIFSFDPSSSVYSKLKDFDYTDGAYPSDKLIPAGDGKLYGVTMDVIFSFDPFSGTYQKLRDFDVTNGASPQGSMMLASDGKLYGMTHDGGSKGAGVIFSYDPSSSSYTKLKDLDIVNGGYPTGSLIQASNGKLYGITGFGGSSGTGVIFSYDLSSATYCKLKDFDYSSAGFAFGSLVQANDGKLYGMTNKGGPGNFGSSYGVIFSFDLLDSAFVKLNDFDGTNGGNPQGSLLQAADGKLYGMTTQGGIDGKGVIFSFNPVSSVYDKMKDFAANETGTGISGSLSRLYDKIPFINFLLLFLEVRPIFHYGKLHVVIRYFELPPLSSAVRIVLPFAE